MLPSVQSKKNPAMYIFMWVNCLEKMPSLSVKRFLYLPSLKAKQLFMQCPFSHITIPQNSNIIIIRAIFHGEC